MPHHDSKLYCLGYERDKFCYPSYSIPYHWGMGRLWEMEVAYLYVNALKYHTLTHMMDNKAQHHNSFHFDSSGCIICLARC